MAVSRSFLATTLLCSAVLLLAPQDAHARRADRTIVATDFDLARHDTDRLDPERYRIEDISRAYPKDQLGPHFAMGSETGLRLEASALGAGRKGAPRLAHVGVYSSF